MALRYQREGYTFRADAHSFVITPGPKPTITNGDLAFWGNGGVKDQ